jgi:hypothetical protein
MSILRNIIIKTINQFIYFLSGHKLYRPIIIKRLEFQNEPHIDKDFLKGYSNAGSTANCLLFDFKLYFAGEVFLKFETVDNF